MAGSTTLFAADDPNFGPTGESEDFTYLTCEYYNSGTWTSGDCRIVVCEGEYLKLSVLPNHYVPTWTGPNGFSYTGQNVPLGYVDTDQAGEYHASYQTSGGYLLTTTITVDVLSEPTLTIAETHETCHGWDGALDLTVSGLQPGVFFELYEGSFSYLPEHFNTDYRNQSGISTTAFDVSLAERSTHFAMRFSATLTVPSTGWYTFYTASDDGSKLYIDGARIVENDGFHSLRERSGNVHLAAGQHQIVVSYFRGNTGEPLQVKYKGPGISKRHIPASALTIPYTVHWSNGACTEDLTNIDDGNYSVWVKYGGSNCTADAHATVNPGWDYLTNPGHITSPNVVECVETAHETFDPPAFETTAATCGGGKQPIYQWQEKTSMNGYWRNIHGATDKDYDPEPRESSSSWYRRLAKCDCASGYANNASTNIRDIHIKTGPELVCEYNIDHTGWTIDDDCTIELCEGQKLQFSTPGCDSNEKLVLTGPNGFHVVGTANCGDILVSRNITAAFTGTYTATLTDLTTGCVTTQNVEIVVNSAPVLVCEYNIDHTGWTIDDDCNIEVCAGQKLQFSTPGCDSNEKLVLTGPNGFHVVGTANCGNILVSNNINSHFSGTYTATLTDLTTGCSTSKLVEITVNGAAWDHVVLGSNVDNCDGVCSGSILVDANFNLTGEYIVQYTFNGSTVMVPGTFTGLGFNTIGGLCAGTYSNITITGVHTGCSAVWPGDIVITEPIGPEVTASGGEIICAGETVTLTSVTSGGTAPLSVKWMPGGATGKTITVTPNETTIYVVTVTDANGCTASADVTVETVSDNLTDPGQITTGNYFECVEGGQTAAPPTFEATPATCSDGSPATYQWQEKTSTGGDWVDIPGATDKNYDPEPREISSSWYRRRAKCDCDGDFASSNVRDVHVKELPVVTVASTDPACEGNNGSITFFFVDNPARTHISFSLNGAGGPFTTVPDSDGRLTFDDLGEGSYNLFVKWGNGQCGTDLDDVTLTAQSGPEVTAPDAEIICESESVTLTATATGGTAPLAIMWMPGGETGASITVSPAETTTYTVKVTDANGCMDTDEVVVTVNETPDFTVTKTDATCDEENGTATASGDAGLTYEWSTGASTATITGLAAGSYGVTATSPAGCTEEMTLVVGSSAGSEVDIICDNTELTTSMARVVQDCRGPFEFGFWTGNMTQNISASARYDMINGKFVENPTDGTATFTGTVVNTGVNTIVFDLVANFTGRTTVASNGSPKENELCIGDLDNSDWYYYADFSGQLVGSGDVAGAIVDFVAFGEPFQVGTGANMFEENEYGASGWLNLSITSQPNDPSKVLINNAKGDINVGLTLPAPMVADCYSICAGGSSILTATATGNPDFTYEWSTGETTSSITVSPNVTTEYSVTITDANGCEATDMVEVVVNDVPTFSVMNTDANCDGPNGSASVTGASSGDLAYEWSTGDAGMSVSGLSEGVYSVTATSPAGCTAVEVFTISATPNVRARIKCDNPELVKRDVDMVAECDRPFMAGFWVGNLIRDVSTSARFDIINGQFVENPADGTAVFTAQLVNQAVSTANFDVVVNFSGRTSVPPVDSPKENELCIGDIDNSDWYYYPDFTGQLTGTDDLTGAIVDIARFGEAFQVGTGANMYDETTFGASGWLQFFIVSQPDDLTKVLVDRGRGDINVNLTGDASTPPVAADCFNIIPGESTVLTAFASSGTPEFTYEWSNGETTPTITVSPTEFAFYRVTITDANGCSDDEIVFVRMLDPSSARTAVTETENGTAGVEAGNLTDTETTTATTARETKINAPAPTAPAAVFGSADFVFELAQNAPNPFSNETVIRFILPEAGHATLTVIDLAGRPVRQFKQGFAAGRNVVRLDGEGLAAGTYVYTLTFNGQRQTRRMIHMPR